MLAFWMDTLKSPPIKQLPCLKGHESKFQLRDSSVFDHFVGLALWRVNHFMRFRFNSTKQGLFVFSIDRSFAGKSAPAQNVITAWKVSKYGVLSGPYFHVLELNTGKYGLEKTQHLNTFHAVYAATFVVPIGVKRCIESINFELPYWKAVVNFSFGNH